MHCLFFPGDDAAVSAIGLQLPGIDIVGQVVGERLIDHARGQFGIEDGKPVSTRRSRLRSSQSALEQNRSGAPSFANQ